MYRPFKFLKLVFLKFAVRQFQILPILINDNLLLIFLTYFLKSSLTILYPLGYNSCLNILFSVTFASMSKSRFVGNLTFLNRFLENNEKKFLTIFKKGKFKQFA